MTTPKLIFVGLLMLMLTNKSLAQQSVPDCADIKVEAKAANPSPGSSNGNIELVFDRPTNNYKILWLNAGRDKTSKEEISGGRISNLKAGFYDILIMDKNKAGCIKQLTVILK
jgi:hypothetical protein